jgi:hypothetical protein
MTTLKHLYTVSDEIHNLHEDLERFALYLDALGYKAEELSVDEIQSLASTEEEHFLGQYKSPAEFARESLTNAYAYEIEALPTMIQNAIDWAQVWDRDYRHDCIEVEAYDDGGYSHFIWHAH